MPRRPRSAKVWNEELVTALRAREEQCRQQGSERQYLWRDGATTIEGVRNDIYKIESSGKLVGMPRKLPVTVDEECRAIIDGRRPILPEGYIPTSLEERRLAAQRGNPYEQDPYLKKIKMRGGAYAILLAFHFSQAPKMTKEQICTAAQPFCDEEMEANFHAGRPYGAWSSQKTLSNHGLIQTHRATTRGSVSTYSITENGRLFLRAMLKKFPLDKALNEEITPYEAAIATDSVGSKPATIYNPYQAAHSSKVPARVSPSSSVPTRRSKWFEQDQKELMAWVTEGGVGRQKKFQVGAARRDNLETLCDDLMEKTSGLILHRKTEGGGSKCTLYISIKAEPKRSPARQLFWGPARSIESPSKRHMESSPVSGTPPKRFRPKDESKTESSLSARRSLFSRANDDPFPSDSSFDDDCWGRGASTSDKTRLTKPKKPIAEPSSQNNVIEILDSDDDENDDEFDRKPSTLIEKKPARRAASLECSFSSDSSEDESLQNFRPFAKSKAQLQATAPKSESTTRKERSQTKQRATIEFLDSDSDQEDANRQLQQVTPVTQDSDDEDCPLALSSSRPANDGLPPYQGSTVQHVGKSVSSGYTLEIQIDNRERNRNATPREMRTELSRHLSTGSLQPVWPRRLCKAEVEEEQLSYGDFAFVLRKGLHEEFRLPLAIERKRIGDLVQRSSKGDHWRQLNRMRDCCDHAIMLIEGDTRTAHQFIVQDDEDGGWNPDSHAVTDESTLIRFIGRAILSTSRIKFIQTKDEQASYRAVGAMGLVVANYQWDRAAPNSCPTGNVEVNKLYNKMKCRGVPWMLARRLAEESGSSDYLSQMYKDCLPSCRADLVVPRIAGTCAKSSDLDGGGSVSGWSKAIYHALHSSLDDPTQVRSLFDEYTAFVEDKPALLCALHVGKTPEQAVQEADAGISPEENIIRIVCISASPTLKAYLPEVVSPESFFEVMPVTKNPLGLSAATIVMQTFAGKAKSHNLCLHVFEGKDIVARIQAACYGQKQDFTKPVRQVAKDINHECTSGRLHRHDRRIVVVRGLRASLDAAAKKAGFRAEVKVLVDVLFSELMLRYNLVVVQAFRLSNDLELIIKEFALACYLHQLITQPV